MSKNIYDHGKASRACAQGVRIRIEGDGYLADERFGWTRGEDSQ